MSDGELLLKQLEELREAFIGPLASEAAVRELMFSARLLLQNSNNAVDMTRADPEELRA
jgi:hypothetical protein